MAFRFVLLLGRWCRVHHRPFPTRVGRVLLVHGFAPLAAMTVGASLWGVLSLSGLLSFVLPALDLGLGGSLMRLLRILLWIPPSWLRPISYLALYGPLVITAVLFWLCRTSGPSVRRRIGIRALSTVLLVSTLPFAHLVGIGLAMVCGAVLVWAFAPFIADRGVAAARWLGLIEGGDE